MKALYALSILTALHLVGCGGSKHVTPADSPLTVDRAPSASSSLPPIPPEPSPSIEPSIVPSVEPSVDPSPSVTPSVSPSVSPSPTPSMTPPVFPDSPSAISPIRVDGFAGVALTVHFTVTDNNGISAVTPVNLAAGATMTTSYAGTSAQSTYHWPSPTVMNPGILYVDVRDHDGRVSRLSVSYYIANRPVTPVRDLPAQVTPVEVRGTTAQPLHVTYAFSDPNGILSIRPLNLAAGASFSYTKLGTFALGEYRWPSPTAMNPGVLYFEVLDRQGHRSQLAVRYFITAPINYPTVLAPLRVDGTPGRTLQVNYTISDPNGIASVVAVNLAPGATFVPTLQGTSATALYTWPSPVTMPNGVLYIDVTDRLGNVTRKSVQYVVTPDNAASATPRRVEGTAGVPIVVNYQFTDADGIASVTALNLAPGASFAPSINGATATAVYRWPSPTYMPSGVLYLRLVDRKDNVTTFSVSYSVGSAPTPVVSPAPTATPSATP